MGRGFYKTVMEFDRAVEGRLAEASYRQDRCMQCDQFADHRLLLTDGTEAFLCDKCYQRFKDQRGDLIDRHSEIRQSYISGKTEGQHKYNTKGFNLRKEDSVGQRSFNEAQHRRDRCMECIRPPTHEVKWAGGMARAWFCDRHYKEFKRKNPGEESCHRVVKSGMVGKKYGEDETPLKEGGQGSGNWGHKGRPGVEGGSQPTTGGAMPTTGGSRAAPAPSVMAKTDFSGIKYGTTVRGTDGSFGKVVRVKDYGDGNQEMHLMINGKYVTTDSANVRSTPQGLFWNGNDQGLPQDSRARINWYTKWAEKKQALGRKYQLAAGQRESKRRMEDELIKAGRAETEAARTHDAEKLYQAKLDKAYARQRHAGYQKIEKEVPG